MSATTSVERVDFKSTPNEIDFKTDSQPLGVASIDFADVPKGNGIDALISIIDYSQSVEIEKKLIFDNPNIHLFRLAKTKDKLVLEKPSVETTSRCAGIFELDG